MKRKSMNKINTNQRLELVRSIRMQNQYNRNQCRERERFLYGHSSSDSSPAELYKTENAALLTDMTGENSYYKKEGFLSGFRIRLFLAIVLFGVFLYLDKTGTEIFGKTTADFFGYITDTMELWEEWDLNSFDL